MAEEGPVCIHCGARGKPTSMRCPECDEYFPAPGAPILKEGPRAPKPLPGVARPHPHEAPEEKVAWEVWVLLVLVALSCAINFINGLWFFGIVNVAMAVGLFKREAWGWWLVFVLAFLGMLGSIFLAYLFEDMIEGAKAVLLIVALEHFGVIFLLILCRARGAYFRETGFS